MTTSPDDTLRTILRNIADDHRNLDLLARTLMRAVSEGRAEQVLGTVLSDLADYASVHFEREEFVMQREHYHLADQHRQEHLAMLDWLSTLILDFERGHPDVAMRTMILLNTWTSEHIRSADDHLIAFLKGNGHKQPE